MENCLTLSEVMDYTAECSGINREIGDFVKHLIDTDEYGQCMFDVAKVLDDMNVMMHRRSTDGDSSIASRPICYEPVETIMNAYLISRAESVRQTLCRIMNACQIAFCEMAGAFVGN